MSVLAFESTAAFEQRVNTGCSPRSKCVNTSLGSGVHHTSPLPPHAECVNVLTQALAMIAEI
eukprot:7181551-Prymnesium_polylepis.2